jgi:protein-histidine pros-kinase
MRKRMHAAGGTTTAVVGIVLLAVGALGVGGGSKPVASLNQTLTVLGAGTMAVAAIVAMFPKVTRELIACQRSERALRKANRELAAAGRAKDRLLAIVSHELRTPLNAIMGFTGMLLLKQPGPLNEAQEKQLRIVEANARHLLALTNDWLDLARIGLGQMPLQVEPVVCQEVIEQVTSSLRILAQAKGLALDVVVPAAEIILPADRRALCQILLNLVGNAVKYTERGGVRVELAERPADGRRHVEIQVTDTGIGIRAEDQAQLFEQFRRVGGREAPQVEGAGLGLHLSQALAALLGGRITVASRHGEGSTFVLHLTPDR